VEARADVTFQENAGAEQRENTTERSVVKKRTKESLQAKGCGLIDRRGRVGARGLNDELKSSRNF